MIKINDLELNDLKKWSGYDARDAQNDAHRAPSLREKRTYGGNTTQLARLAVQQHDSQSSCET